MPGDRDDGHDRTSAGPATTRRTREEPERGRSAPTVASNGRHSSHDVVSPLSSPSSDIGRRRNQIRPRCRTLCWTVTSRSGERAPGGFTGTGVRVILILEGGHRDAYQGALHGHAEHGHRRAGQVRLQAGAGPLAGALFLVRRRVQLHLDHDRGVRAVLLRLFLGRACVHLDLAAVFAGQMLVALCFAELAGQFPLAGSVYQWSKQIARSFTSWIGGWVLSVGAVVTLAAVAVAYQVVAPQISSRFQIIGTKADISLVSTPGGAKNALLLAALLVVFTTVINMVGVKTSARINNFRVAAGLVV